MQYIVVSIVIIFFMEFKIEENYLFILSNTERILISEAPNVVSDKTIFFKYSEFEESKFWDTKTNITSK